ncbi:MAG TPA: N-acetyltransferase [Alphaproteobacteria bacterium]|nr:N-acetyltransferase [Alphaproteobacteria bacterium]
MFDIVAERPHDAAPREQLLDLVFGPARMQRTVYRLRDGVAPVRALSLVALFDGAFQGSLRFWPVRVAGAAAPLLLGPLAVDPARRGQAIGVALVRRGLREVARCGHDLVLVVGEPHYYARFGFEPAPPFGLSLPGPVDETRFQVLVLDQSIRGSVGGGVTRAAT